MHGCEVAFRARWSRIGSGIHPAASHKLRLRRAPCAARKGRAMRKIVIGVVLALVVGATATYAWSVTGQESANGHGTLLATNEDGRQVKRQFSFSARRHDDGTVTGQAVLINPAFSGENGRSPYQLHVDISCMRVVGNIAIFGGTTKRTNDPNLVERCSSPFRTTASLARATTGSAGCSSGMTTRRRPAILRPAC
jgi:hypothetical protein